jgi:hypothetical protein
VFRVQEERSEESFLNTEHCGLNAKRDRLKFEDVTFFEGVT